MSRRSVVSLVLLVLALGLLVGFYFNQPAPKVVTVVKQPSKKLAEMAKTSPGRPKLENEKMAASSDQCESFATYLETTPFEVITADLQERKVTLPVGCDAKQSSQMLDLWKKAVAGCAKDVQGTECIPFVMLYRAARLSEFYKNTPIKDLPLDAIVQKIFALLGQNQLNSEDGILQLRTLAKEILSRDPNSGGAAKAEVLSYVIEKASASDGNAGIGPWDPAKESEMQQALSKATELNPDDNQIYEVALLDKMFPVTNDKFRSLQEQVQNNPNSAILNYMAACAAWKLQRADDARIYFQRAAALGTEDPRYQESYQKSQTAGVGSPICTFKVAFNDGDF